MRVTAWPTNGAGLLRRLAVVGATTLTLATSAAGIGEAQEPLDLGAARAPDDQTGDSADDAAQQEGAAATDAPAPDVGLDQLLRLPNSLDFKEERRGGGGASDWRRRFRESEGAIASAQENLAEAERAMDEAATAGSGQWQIAPPGQQASSGENGPLSFKLREDLRRARTKLEEAERRHRALIVEADLAGVPPDWRTGEG